MVETVTLYRPVGQGELDLVAESGWKRFPPRFAFQPIFYPVLNQEYAEKIARDWNTKDEASGYVGYVLRFQVRADVCAKYPPQTVGSSLCRELWVPSEELDGFNDAIVGQIELLSEFRAD